MGSIVKVLVGKVLEVKRLPENELGLEVRDQRLVRCLGDPGKGVKPCPFLKGDKCSICGCWVEIKAEFDFNKNPKKAFRIEKTHCPKGYWPYIDEEGNKRKNDLVIANYYNNLN